MKLASWGKQRANIALNAFIRKQHLQLAGPLTIVFFDEENLRFQGGDYEVEMFYPIEETDLQHPMVSSYGGHWVFTTLHLGDYTELPDVFDRLRKRIAEQHLVITGQPFEQYLVDYLYLNNKDSFLTRVGFPIQSPPKVKQGNEL